MHAGLTFYTRPLLVKFNANMSAVCLRLLLKFHALCVPRENHMPSKTDVFVQQNTERPNAATFVPSLLSLPKPLY
jgi:hypothetical protein